MKKIVISFLISLFIITGINIPAFGDTYVPSIGVRTDIGIDGGTLNPDGVYEKPLTDGTGTVVVTPYYFKETIKSDESKTELQEAYEKIIEAPTVSSLNSKILDYAHRNCSTCVVEENLVIRDVFDITAYAIDENGNYEKDKDNNYIIIKGIKYFEIIITTEEIEHFVCLLHYKNGAFEIVDEARLVFDNGHLYVSVDELSPFVIVTVSEWTCHVEDTDTDTGTTGKYVHPKTGIEGEECMWHYYIIATAIITAILAMIINKKIIRNIIFIINLILCIAFYVLGLCSLDLYALIIDIILLVILFIFKKNEKE